MLCSGLARKPAQRLASLREFWIAARIGSPWIGEVIETPLATRSCLYTLMPFYRGETLEQRLRRAPVGRAEGLDIAMKLGKSVAALHRTGVVHRDIKPDNVVLQPDGGLKLIDLGVARLPNIDDFPVSAAPGTPSYMAPELHAGALGDAQSDLFALGVTLFPLRRDRAVQQTAFHPDARFHFRPPAGLALVARSCPHANDRGKAR